MSVLTYTQPFVWSTFGTTLLPTLGHTWTLSVEEQFYLVWPLVVYFTPRSYLPLVIAGGIAGAVFVRNAPEMLASVPILAHLIPPRLDSLLIGAALAATICLVRAARPLACLGLVLIASFLIGNLVGADTDQDSWFNHCCGSVLVALASAIFIVFCEAGRRNGPLAHPVLVRIGKMSYGIYLIHLPVFSVLIIFEMPCCPPASTVLSR